MRTFLKIQWELSVQSTNEKKILIDNHYKTIFKSVSNACTSYSVFKEVSLLLTVVEVTMWIDSINKYICWEPHSLMASKMPSNQIEIQTLSFSSFFLYFPGIKIPMQEWKFFLGPIFYDGTVILPHLVHGSTTKWHI